MATSEPASPAEINKTMLEKRKRLVTDMKRNITYQIDQEYVREELRAIEAEKEAEACRQDKKKVDPDQRREEECLRKKMAMTKALSHKNSGVAKGWALVNNVEKTHVKDTDKHSAILGFLLNKSKSAGNTPVGSSLGHAPSAASCPSRVGNNTVSTTHGTPAPYLTRLSDVELAERQRSPDVRKTSSPSEEHRRRAQAARAKPPAVNVRERRKSVKELLKDAKSLLQ